MTSTVRDRHAATTVVDLVPPELVRGARLYPVGRLDQDSEGLILLTNDGDWAEHVLHPRYGVEREYAVALTRMLNRDQAEALEGGVELAEGVATLTGLRAQTRTEDRRLDDLLEPPPDPGARLGAVHDPPGLEAPAAADVRGRRRARAAARPRPDRDAAPRRARRGRRPGPDHGRGRAAWRPAARSR